MSTGSAHKWNYHLPQPMCRSEILVNNCSHFLNPFSSSSLIVFQRAPRLSDWHCKALLKQEGLVVQAVALAVGMACYFTIVFCQAIPLGVPVWKMGLCLSARSAQNPGTLGVPKSCWAPVRYESDVCGKPASRTTHPTLPFPVTASSCGGRAWLAATDGLILHKFVQASFKATQVGGHHSFLWQRVPQVSLCAA